MAKFQEDLETDKALKSEVKQWNVFAYDVCNDGNRNKWLLKELQKMSLGFGILMFFYSMGCLLLAHL